MSDSVQSFSIRCTLYQPVYQPVYTINLYINRYPKPSRRILEAEVSDDFISYLSLMDFKPKVCYLESHSFVCFIPKPSRHSLAEVSDDFIVCVC